MATVRVTEKQKEKLKINSEFFRTNSADLTVNPNGQDIAEYDDGYLSFDKRTSEGKEIDRILKSRNRSHSNIPEDSENHEEEPDDEYWETEDDFYEDEDEDSTPWEYRNPENYWSYILGPDHDEDDESVADWGED